MSKRAGIEAAVSASADRMSPGSGAQAVKHFKNDIGMLDFSQDDSIKRITSQDALIVVPAVFESKHADGDPVTIQKPHDGLIAVFPAGVVFVHGVGFGMRESKGIEARDLSVDAITTVLNGDEVPGLRISSRSGRPKVAAAIVQEGVAADSAQQAALRDEIIKLVAG